MDTEQPTPTPEQARSALAEAEANAVRDRRDVQVHALAVAGFGTLIGLFVAARELFSGPWTGLLTAAYLAGLVGLATWQTRAPRSAPRHSKRTGYLGLAGTLVMVVVSVGLLNWRGHDRQPELWLVLLSALLVATPMLLAAARIYRAARR